MLSGGEDAFKQNITVRSSWKYDFLPTICPRCGWNLGAERDSVTLVCGNCDTAWEVLKGKFVEVDFMAVSGEPDADLYLPFWKISAKTNGIKLGSYADFLRLTNQPIVIDKSWGKMEMNFWNSAFKIRPKTFLQVSKQLTVSQRFFKPDEKIPKKNLYPVTLPRTEAIQSMKIVLANAAVNKKQVIPNLPDMTFEIG